MYESLYNFAVLPFENTPDPRFFYASEQHREALAAIEYTIRMRKGIILITGDIGSGKTTVGRAMLHTPPFFAIATAFSSFTVRFHSVMMQHCFAIVIWFSAFSASFVSARYPARSSRSHAPCSSPSSHVLRFLTSCT